VEPFDLMYNIQLGKSAISFCCLVATNGVQDFLHTLSEGGFMLVILGLTGAVGQVRVRSHCYVNRFCDVMRCNVMRCDAMV
jgi:hypothetical protein